MRVKVFPDICIGCVLCIQTCPGIFKMEDDKAIVNLDSISEEAEELCRKASDECPVIAINIEE